MFKKQNVLYFKFLSIPNTRLWMNKTNECVFSGLFVFNNLIEMVPRMSEQNICKHNK